MLEILGQSTNPTVIQTHLKKLFAGIHSVDFDEGNKNIIAMKSLDGEIVPLKRKVEIMPEVEVQSSCYKLTLSTHSYLFLLTLPSNVNCRHNQHLECERKLLISLTLFLLITTAVILIMFY